MTGSILKKTATSDVEWIPFILPSGRQNHNENLIMFTLKGRLDKFLVRLLFLCTTTRKWDRHPVIYTLQFIHASGNLNASGELLQKTSETTPFFFSLPLPSSNGIHFFFIISDTNKPFPKLSEAVKENRCFRYCFWSRERSTALPSSWAARHANLRAQPFVGFSLGNF